MDEASAQHPHYGPYSQEEYEARWLRFELIADLGVSGDLAEPIFQEAFRIEPLLNRDADWRAWWTATSKAPALDLGICIAWPDNQWFPEKVSMGRKQHLVRMHMDAGSIEATAKPDRPALLAPAMREALGRLISNLNLAPAPATFPPGVLVDP